MDKERLRIPSDSSSGSSSRGGASPNLPGYRNTKPAYMCGGNGVGPPSNNSPANFSPLLPSSPHNLPPPPGLPHPSLGSIYQFPTCPSQGYPNMNYPLGMTAMSAGAQSSQSQLHGRYPPVSGVHGGQYMNGYAVQQNGIVQQPTTSPPPGYNYYGSVQHQYPAQTLPHGCSMHPTQQQNCEPFSSSQHIQYDQSGDSFELEKRLSLLLNSANSCTFDNGNSYSSDFMPSQLLSHHEEIQRDNAPSGVLNKDKEIKQSAKMGGVMNPIIENLVGSMAMSNGTYTHFGPSISPSNTNIKAQNGQKDFFSEMSLAGRQNGNVEHERKAMFSHIAVPSVKETGDGLIRENFMRESFNTTSKQPNIASVVQPILDNTNEMKSIINLNNSNNCSAVSGPVTKPRTSSPLDAEESSSRPQTPGKPSYLEVLTKVGLKSQQASHSARKTSSTSSSPVQSVFSVSSESVPNLSQRKSIDYFMGAASTPSSSCPSSSSSPATKPRNLTSGTLLKGKENVSISAANNYIKQTARNSPSGSPAHVQSQLNKTKSQQGPMVGVERKVLSSQNSTSGGSKNSKGFKNGKVPSEKSIDVEEINEEGDWGWKTYTTRGRNNNLSSVGNKNSQKRSSNGHCSSEPAASSFSVMDDDDDDDDDSEARKSVIDEGSSERKSSSSTFGSTTSSSTVTSTTSHTRKPREKEKSRSRKEDRNCVSRRLENLAYTWLTHMISALTWLWTLITDVASLSASLGVSLMQDFYIWTKTKALPNFSDKITGWQRVVRHTCHDWWYSCRSKLLSLFSRGSSSKPPEDSGNSKPGIRHDENILSLLGPERNISLPANGDEALKRLLSVKGQDPYSILGVRSDSNEETIRRYYKRQAVLVHPDKNLIVGAEEAFKILARAFEMVGDPLKRAEYHQKLMEAQAKEKFCGEIGNLLEQLRKKMEAASSTIRCTKCNSRHKKNMTDRPLFAARYCSQCRIHHGAREGELWAERGGWFGISWNYFACMDAHVWEINEWARCQKTNLKHIKADAHCVMYRLVAGGNNQQNHNQHCHGTEGEDRFGAGSEADEWDSLINNLCKSSSGSTFGKTTGVPGKAGCCASGGMNANGSSSSSTNQAGKRRKGKRNK